MQNIVSWIKNNRFLLTEIALLAAVGLVVFVVIRRPTIKKLNINSFQECVDAGYPVQESFPETCRLPDGSAFIKPSEAVAAPTEVRKSLSIDIMVTGSPSQALPDFNHLTVTSPNQWKQSWNAIFASFKPIPPLLEVDFTKYTVVAVFAGQKPTAGYTIRVTSVEEEDKRLAVRVKEYWPGNNCITAQAVNYPYQIIKFPYRDKPVEFIRDHDVKDCK